jgi:Ca2+-transporting ATPase
MLWVNLIMDTFAALALATEPASEAVMSDKPRDPKAFIITPEMWMDIGTMGILFFIVMILMLICNVELTIFFTVFVMLQWWNLFNARVFGQNRSIFNGLGSNPAFICISLIILIGQILIVQFGGEMFRTEPLSFMQWLIIIGSTSAVVIMQEGLHWVKKVV